MMLFILIIGSNSLLAKNIVNITKSKGGASGYRDIQQTWTGIDVNGNDHWNLTCANPGWSPCKLNPGGNFVYHELPLPVERSLTAALPFMAEMELKADVAIINGATEGDDEIKIAIPYEGGVIKIYHISYYITLYIRWFQ